MADCIIGQLSSAKPGGRASLALTTRDALWMARAVVGESTTDAKAVTSTMLRRWAFVTDNRGERGPIWPDLTTLLIGTETQPGYSQPVAFQWRDRGTPQQLARRERVRSLEWHEIPAHVRNDVIAIMSGRRGLVRQGAVHFAAPGLSRRFLDENPGSRRIGGGRNWFIATRESATYPDPLIVPGPDAPPESGSKDGFAAALGGLLVLGALL